MTPFETAFLVCFLGYAAHTITHYLEHIKSPFRLSGKMADIVIHIGVFAGYFAWVYMLYSDPSKLEIPGAQPVGLLMGLAGLLILVAATKKKKGYKELGYVVTTGIYSRIRHPMYLAIILIHIGFPLALGKAVTLASAAIWIPFILFWKSWEEEELVKRFGKKYRDYKKRTIF